MCITRGPQDKWAEAVRSRIDFAQDLHAADALYHNQCNMNFRANKSIPQFFRRSAEAKKADVPKGRPKDVARADAFLRVVNNFAENDDEQITLTDLCEKMKEYLNGDTPYTEKYMRIKLESYFGGEVIMTCIGGKQNAVTFRSTAEKILEQFFKSSKEKDSTKEKMRIIKTAAKFLLVDIKNIEMAKEEYPTSADVADLATNLDFIPPSLLGFWGTLFGHPETLDQTFSVTWGKPSRLETGRSRLTSRRSRVSQAWHHTTESSSTVFARES